MKNPIIDTKNTAIAFSANDDKNIEKVFWQVLAKEIKKMKVKGKIGFDFGTKKRFEVVRKK